MSLSKPKTEPPHDEAAISGVDPHWIALGFATLGCTTESDGTAMRVAVPEDERPYWDDRAELQIDPDQIDHRLIAKLWDRIRQTTGCVHAAPADQPVQVHQLTDRLFAPYTVDGGRPHLAGCALDPRPFLRMLSAVLGDQPALYFDRTGRPLDDDRARRLGLDELIPFSEGSSRLARDELLSWIESVDEIELGSAPLPPLVAWCRYANGKLAFQIGDEEVLLPFEGWAREIASGHTPMPPYRCPLSGRESYHLAADDNGRITVVEAIAVCEVSGRRVIETDLEICQETGKRALKEYLATCEQTHRRVLKSALQPCDMCRRQLASVSLSRGRCEACRHLTPVRKDDPTLARLLHQYPKLDAWGRWRIGETPKLFLFTAASWTQKLLLVVDKHSLEVFRLATRGPMGGHWTDAPPKLREELTG